MREQGGGEYLLNGILNNDDDIVVVVVPHHLHHVCAISLTATCSPSPIKSFVALGPWVHMSLSFMTTGLIVIRGHWWSFNSHWVVFVVTGVSLSFVACWPLFAAHCLLGMWLSIGQLSYFGHPG